MKNEFITYGIFIRKDKFNTITDKNNNFFLNKPSGGIWGSPTESEFSWKKWCELNDFRLENLKFYTKWRLRNPRKILIIDSYEDLVNTMNRFGENYTPLIGIKCYNLNFTKIKEAGYDGMMLTERGNIECHLPLKSYQGSRIDLNAWDCESIVVWNWNQIRIIEMGRL